MCCFDTYVNNKMIYSKVRYYLYSLTLLYIRSLELIHLIARSLYPLIKKPLHFPQPPALGNHQFYSLFPRDF